jgi:hypothetical protein
MYEVLAARRLYVNQVIDSYINIIADQRFSNQNYIMKLPENEKRKKRVRAIAAVKNRGD